MIHERFSRDPTARGDEMADELRHYYETHRPKGLRDWWSERVMKRWRYGADNLMIGMLDVASWALARAKEQDRADALTGMDRDAIAFQGAHQRLTEALHHLIAGGVEVELPIDPRDAAILVDALECMKKPMPGSAWRTNAAAVRVMAAYDRIIADMEGSMAKAGEGLFVIMPYDDARLTLAAVRTAREAVLEFPEG